MSCVCLGMRWISSTNIRENDRQFYRNRWNFLLSAIWTLRYCDLWSLKQHQYIFIYWTTKNAYFFLFISLYTPHHKEIVLWFREYMSWYYKMSLSGSAKFHFVLYSTKKGSHYIRILCSGDREVAQKQILLKRVVSCLFPIFFIWWSGT
jgi:hypothetical protein